MSPSTRKVRAAIFRRIIATKNPEGAAAGDALFAELKQRHILKGRDDRAGTPAAARHFVDTMRGLCSWGVEAGYLAESPTTGVSTPKKSGDGFAMWTEEDIAKFEARWPLGSRERVAFAVLQYTGLRRGDASRFGRPHVKGNVGRITTEKTGEHVVFRLEQPLLDALEAGPVGEWTFIARDDGRPFIKESFGNWFREICTAAGVPDKSAHGLRKAGATRDAEDGWTEAELDAKYGWRGGRMAAKYTDKMNREKLALAASDRVKSRTSISAPDHKVREFP